jgi:two-component system NtrC family sensor kinase
MKSTVTRTNEEVVLEALTEQAPVGISIMQDGKFCYVNSFFSTAIGYTADELVGEDSLEIVVPEDREMVRKNAIKMLKGETRSPYEFRVIRKDRGITWVVATVKSTEYHGRRAALGNYLDITERKQAEEALEKSEERYRQLAENAGEAIFVVQDHVVKFINPKGAELCGYSVQEMVSKPFVQLLHPNDVDMVANRYARRLKGEAVPQTYEFRIIKKDGDFRWAELNAVTASWDDRPAVLCFANDVTERKQAEEAVRQSEERYRTILEEMEDAYFEIDLGGHFTFVNSSTCRALGYPKEELIGMSYKKTTLENAYECVFRVFNEVYRSGVPNRSSCWTVVSKDGTHRLVEHSAFPLRNGKGDIIGFRGVGRDITERRQAEEKLRRSEENYRALFDNTVIGTIVLDAETMEIAMVNQAAAKMFGFSSVEEARKANPLELVRADDKDRVLDLAMKGLFDQDSHQSYELSAITNDGREIWINATGARIMHEDRLSGLICFADITEQKRQRERLMMTDRLASVGELAAGTAHELNNPLTAIIGFSDLLMSKQVPDDVREDLKLINNEAQRAANITRNLLTFARKHAPVKQPNQVNSIIEDVLELRAHMQKTNAIEVERHLASDLPEVMVDYSQMQQVFLNIIVNAEYFMTEAHNRGTLTITTKKQNGTVSISIADDGPGIPSENLGRIFDPFFTTKEPGKGTGLGLSICHGIVTEHGGQIYVRSRLGSGAAFFVELPINHSSG